MMVMVKWKVGTLHFIHLYDSHFLKWTAWRDRVPAASVNTLGKYLEMASVMWGSSLGLVQLVSSKKNLSAVSDLTKIKSAMNIYGMFPTELGLVYSISNSYLKINCKYLGSIGPSSILLSSNKKDCSWIDLAWLW